MTEKPEIARVVFDGGKYRVWISDIPIDSYYRNADAVDTAQKINQAISRLANDLKACREAIEELHRAAGTETIQQLKERTIREKP